MIQKAVRSNGDGHQQNGNELGANVRLFLFDLCLVVSI